MEQTGRDRRRRTGNGYPWGGQLFIAIAEGDPPLAIPRFRFEGVSEFRNLGNLKLKSATRIVVAIIRSSESRLPVILCIVSSLHSCLYYGNGIILYYTDVSGSQTVGSEEPAETDSQDGRWKLVDACGSVYLEDYFGQKDGNNDVLIITFTELQCGYENFEGDHGKI